MRREDGCARGRESVELAGDALACGRALPHSWACEGRGRPRRLVGRRCARRSPRWPGIGLPSAFVRGSALSLVRKSGAACALALHSRWSDHAPWSRACPALSLVPHAVAACGLRDWCSMWSEKGVQHMVRRWAGRRGACVASWCVRATPGHQGRLSGFGFRVSGLWFRAALGFRV